MRVGVLSLREWLCCPFSSQDFCSPCDTVRRIHNTMDTTSQSLHHREQGPRATSHHCDQHANWVGVCASAQVRADSTECFSVRCVGYQRKRDFLQQGRPLLQPFSICTFFSKQEPCSLPRICHTPWVWVKQLKTTRVLAARRHP